MRKDILINDDTDDLLIQNTFNPVFSIGSYVGEEAGYSVMSVRLRGLGDNDLDVDRLGDLAIEGYVKIHDNFIGTNPLLVYFYYTDEHGRMHESPKLPFVNGRAEPLDKYKAREIDPSGLYVKYLKTSLMSWNSYVGGFVAEVYEQGDFAVDNAIPQCEKLLLLANKGNLLEHPLRGVEITKELNSNLDRDVLRDRVFKEFEKDELIVTDFDIDAFTGFIEIKSKEMYENENS